MSRVHNIYVEGIKMCYICGKDIKRPFTDICKECDRKGHKTDRE